MKWLLFEDAKNIRFCLIREDERHAYYEPRSAWAMEKLMAKARSIDPVAQVEIDLRVASSG